MRSPAGFMTACLALLAPVAAQAGYVIATFDAPGATDTFVTAFNNAGQVAGYYNQNGRNGGFAGFDRGFVGLPGSLTAFDAPGATRGTFPAALNASGQVAGTFGTGSPATASTLGFAGQLGSLATFGGPSGSGSPDVRAINASGQVAGIYGVAGGIIRGFTGLPGNLAGFDAPGAAGDTFLTAFNDSGEVAGQYNRGFTASGFVGLPGSLTSFGIPDAGSTIPEVTGLNNAGEVAGYYLQADGRTFRGFVGLPGSLATFGAPDGVGNPLVEAVNASGEVAGDLIRGDVTLGFAGTPGNLTTFALPGGTANYITAINDSGQVAGYYFQDGFHGFIATPDGVSVPEPTSLALIGTGIASLFALRRRKHGDGRGSLA